MKAVIFAFSILTATLSIQSVSFAQTNEAKLRRLTLEVRTEVRSGIGIVAHLRYDSDLKDCKAESAVHRFFTNPCTSFLHTCVDANDELNQLLRNIRAHNEVIVKTAEMNRNMWGMQIRDPFVQAVEWYNMAVDQDIEYADKCDRELENIPLVQAKTGALKCMQEAERKLRDLKSDDLSHFAIRP
jgi:hypothetical protein